VNVISTTSPLIRQSIDFNHEEINVFQDRPTPIKHGIFKSLHIDLDVSRPDTVFGAEMIQASRGYREGMSSPGFDDVICGTYGFVRYPNGSVVVADCEIEQSDVVPMIEPHVIGELQKCCGMRFKGPYLRAFSLGTQQRVHPDVGTNVEEDIARIEERLKQSHIVVVVQPLTVDQCGSGTASMRRAYL
jgi:hypothetical protein